MNFVTPEFILFFFTGWLFFIISPTKYRFYTILILSYIFYASWSPYFLLLMLLSTSMAYWMGKIISNSHSSSIRKLALTMGILSNIFVLFLFKYFYFFQDIIKTFLPHVSFPDYNFILPLGISFYTFEAISYLVDVYRGKQAAPNWLDYNFYITFFPHLVAGPIIRFTEIYKQFSKQIALPSYENLNKGSQLILYGFIYKIIIADYVATIVDPVFAQPQQYHSLSIAIALLAFAAQIYYDFLGYTHIARGVALFFNIELPLNFNQPYISKSIREFWNRWHISLSLWIRDYLYFPLGGSRGTLLRTTINLIVVMTICGLWHGASFHFVLWGLYHGVLMSIERVLRRYKLGLVNNSFFYRISKWFLTFSLVVYGWLLFRSESVDKMIEMTSRLLNIRTLSNLTFGQLSLQIVTAISLILLCVGGSQIEDLTKKFKINTPLWLKLTFVSFFLIIWMILRSDSPKAFIYFQF